jgi:hypothetical protein
MKTEKGGEVYRRKLTHIDRQQNRNNRMGGKRRPFSGTNKKRKIEEGDKEN